MILYDPPPDKVWLAEPVESNLCLQGPSLKQACDLMSQYSKVIVVHFRKRHGVDLSRLTVDQWRALVRWFLYLLCGMQLEGELCLQKMSRKLKDIVGKKQWRRLKI